MLEQRLKIPFLIQTLNLKDGTIHIDSNHTPLSLPFIIQTSLISIQKLSHFNYSNIYTPFQDSFVSQSPSKKLSFILQIFCYNKHIRYSSNFEVKISIFPTCANFIEKKKNSNVLSTNIRGHVKIKISILQSKGQSGTFMLIFYSYQNSSMLLHRRGF